MKRGRAVAAEYHLDVLGDKPQLSLPTHSRESAPPQRGSTGARGGEATGVQHSGASGAGGAGVGAPQRNGRFGGGGGELPGDMRAKLATVLAKEFARKVQASSTALLPGSKAQFLCCGVLEHGLADANIHFNSIADSNKSRCFTIFNRLLILHFNVQVYVTVYSDGPTRVLRLSDEPNITSKEAEQTVLDLAARLQQVLS